MTGIKFYWFDMDHTLIDNDCDVSWKEFAVARGMAPPGALAIADAFYKDYERGCLDHAAFSRFQLAEFSGKTPAEMAKAADEHFVEYVLPKVYLKAKAYIEEIQESGGRTGILTATNTVLAKPLADYFKVDILLGTELEISGGRFTGNHLPPYAGGEGKVAIMREFSDAVKIPAAELAYFGDSINDRNILEFVGHPFAANPSPALRELAEKNHWEIISFK